MVRCLTYNFPNSESDTPIHSGDLSYQASCPNRNYYFRRLIYNITGVEGIQIQNLQVAYVLVGGGERGSDYIVGKNKQLALCE